jgi:hypothetical protein
VAEGGGLLNRCTGSTRTVSSNLIPSASSPFRSTEVAHKNPFAPTPDFMRTLSRAPVRRVILKASWIKSGTPEHVMRATLAARSSTRFRRLTATLWWRLEPYGITSTVPCIPKKL